MRRVGFWVITFSVVFAVLPLIVSYAAVLIGDLANCSGPQENGTCEIWGVEVDETVWSLSSLGLLVYLTVPVSLLGIVAGVIFLVVGDN